MAVNVHYTEFEEDSGIWRIEIFQGTLASSPSMVQFDNAALDLDDSWEEGIQNNGMGIFIPSSFKCKVDIAKIPTALKKIITTPQTSYDVGQYNPSTCWVVKRNDKYPGKVATGSINTGGTGYSNASNVSTTGGSGTGLKLNITTSGGVVTAVTIADGGRDYAHGDLVTITGGASDATYLVNTTEYLDVWHVVFVGTQYQGLDKDWKPFELDRRLDVEVFDIKTDILSQTTFKDLAVEILAQTASGWDAEVVMKKFAIDYYMVGSNASLAANNNAFSVRYYESPKWMRFYKVKRIFEALGNIVRNISITKYGLGYITSSSDIYNIASPLNHWRFFKQSYSEDAFAYGDPVAPGDIYTLLFVTDTDVSNPTYDDILDGLIANGKSSLEERFKGKGVIEWLNKEWESHLAKARTMPYSATSQAWTSDDTDAAPIWFPQKFGEHVTSATVVTPTIEVSDIYDDAVVKKAEEFITASKVVVTLNADEHFESEYTSKVTSSRKEQNRDYELTFHNMPSIKKGLKYRAGSVWGALDWLRAAPLGVLFYIGDTGMTAYGYADMDNDIPIRVSERAYCILDADAAIGSSDAAGTTKDLFSTTGFDFTDATQHDNWDVTATRAQPFSMAQHVADSMMKIFGNPDRLNFEFTIPLSEYRDLCVGQRVLLDVRELINDADIFENVGANYVFITDLERNIVQNTLRVKAISEGYNG